MGGEGQVLDFDSCGQIDSVGSLGREVREGVWASSLTLSGKRGTLF